MRRLLVGFVWLASCCGVNGAGGAEVRNQIIIEVAGEAYQGAPIFQVRFDGVVIGTGVLRNPIDTTVDGRLFEADDPRKYVETFRFEIPQKVFRPSGTVEIHFTNDAWGGEGENQYDRNLFVSSISVNGKKIAAADLKLQRRPSVTEAGTESFAPPGEGHGFIALAETEIEALAVPDNEGWPLPAAGTRGVPTPDADKTAPPPQLSNNVEHAIRVDETPKAGVASGNGEPRCRGLVDVAGFEKNSFDLSPTQRTTLDGLVSEVADKSCTFEVVGYASRGGRRSTNKRISIARANAVADYLKERHIPAASVRAVGSGQTAKFGVAATDNQRVVITISER